MDLRSKFIVVSLSVVAATAIGTFAIFRYIQGDMLMAALDSSIAALFAALGFYTYWSGKIDFVRYLAVVVSVVSTLVTTWVSPDTGSYWLYVTTLAIYYLLSSYIYALSISSGLLVATVVVLLFTGEESHVSIISYMVTTIVINVIAFLFAFNNDRFQKQLEILTVTDALTELGNRRAFMDKVGDMVDLYRRLHLPACLLYLDVDSFKRINDLYGHEEGDRILINIADCLTTTLRKTDSIYRLGGDEFVILVEGTNQEQAALLAEKVRYNVEQLQLSSGENISVSIGGSEVTKADSGKSWTSRADKALYQAKNAGKNKVAFIAANDY